MEQNLTVVETGGALQSWEGAAERGLQARHEREGIIARVLKAELDFGIIPGTSKPTLLKAGAEKIIDSLNLYADYERIGVQENWDRQSPLFSYTYRAVLKLRGANYIIATGIGSCNSLEARYRWRNTERICPQCKAPAIIKGKEEYGGGWLCWQKKAGCGAKFKAGDVTIDCQIVGKVENDDVFSLVNTVDKMAQKRALVAATLNLGFSEQFTQDMEDLQPGAVAAEPPVVSAPQAAPPAEDQKPPETWRGTIMNVETKQSPPDAKKPWTLYSVHADDGTTFGTFNHKLAKRCEGAVNEGTEVQIEWTPTKKGGKDIYAVREAAQDAVQ